MNFHQVKFSILVVLSNFLGLVGLHSQTFSSLLSAEQELKINNMVNRWDNQTKPWRCRLGYE